MLNCSCGWEDKVTFERWDKKEDNYACEISEEKGLGAIRAVVLINTFDLIEKSHLKSRPVDHRP